ncbi:hypothetical protein C7S16_4494 [Burkholderia thailandensis]|uniref:Uncharacterized protein n=1 Tax=Burkholderia thailandensis TaxID=57975 RepID=A0AAW9CQ00_BURTH|nr:hypothetical protein [Burkholderia thailandensis]MDW9251686.1 hypothetical protein [Burkholderia thailandensis]
MRRSDAAAASPGGAAGSIRHAAPLGARLVGQTGSHRIAAV